jgi:GNAT superfamily N-acetyltransferase
VIRRAESDADLAAYARIWSSVYPEKPLGGEEVRRRAAERTDGRQYLLAHVDEEAVGTGFASRTSVDGRAAVLVSVVPSFRNRGLGAALLEASERVAHELGCSSGVGQLSEEHLGWAERRRYGEFDREIELVLDLRGDEQPPRPEGIEIGELVEHELEAAFRVVAAGVADVPAAEPFDSSFDRWRNELAGAPLVLVARERGRIVGYAELERRTDDVLGHNFTTVARSHRRRGIARALKQAQIAWAAGHGCRRLTTSTHLANAATRRLNASLGYRPLAPVIWVRKEFA